MSRLANRRVHARPRPKAPTTPATHATATTSDAPAHLLGSPTTDVARRRLAPSMQRALGNRRTAEVLGTGRMAQAAAGVLQRREENPYQERGEVGGWDLTAHHVVAHSKLVEALSRLSGDQKKAILAQAIPDKLDAGMLEGAGLKLLPEQMNEGFIGTLKTKLRDPENMEIVNNTRLSDVRQSFFEWQGGNQFSGPNTSIRAEPSPSKDAMDTDARFLGVSNYEELETKGKLLYEQLGNEETTDEAIFKTLQQILAVTRDTKPTAFDVNQWQELTSVEEIEQLASTDLLGRDHLTGYSYFKFAVGDLASKHPAIVPTNSGQSEFKYGSVPKIPAQAKSTFGYVKLTDARGTIPTAKAQLPLREVLSKEGVTTAGSGGTVTATIPPGLVAHNRNAQLRLQGYTGLVRYTKQEGSEFTFSAPQLDVNLTYDAPGTSLYDYCIETGMPTSSFLPKRLYDLLQEQSRLPGLEEQLRKAESDLTRFSVVIKDLSTSGWRRRMGSGDRKQQQLLRKMQLEDYKGRAKRTRAQTTDLQQTIARIREAGRQLQR